MFGPLDNIVPGFFNIKVNPVQQGPLQNDHGVQFLIELIKLVNWLNNFKNLLVTRVEVDVKLLLFNEVHAVINQHPLGGHLEKGCAGWLLKVFALLDKGPLLRTDLPGFLSQL